MTLDQLRVFVAVAEQQHVTRAANVLSLSQSAVSSSIAALETQYDVKLFHRIRRNIVLTDAGQQFLDEARAVLARASSAGNMLADLAGLRRGALSLAASQTVANYWIPRVMQRFHAAHPGVSLKLSITNTGQVVRQVAEGAVDLGFVEDQVDAEGLEVRAVAQDELVLVVAPSHPWAHLDSTTADIIDLRDSAWVLREQESGTRGIFEKMVQQPGRRSLRLRDRAGASIERGGALGGRGWRRRDRDVPAGRGFLTQRRDAHSTPLAAAAAGIPDVASSATLCD